MDKPSPGPHPRHAFVFVAIAVFQFSWSFQEYAGRLFLEKKAVSGHHVPSTPTGKPL
jgi:hypothetical protein